MAVLGKRKASEPEAAAVSEEDANEIFRRHFEARFAPIETPQEKRRRAMEDEDEDEDGPCRVDEEEEEEDGNDDSEWGGLSDDEDDEISDDDNDNNDSNDEEDVEVVDHSTSQTPKATTMSKRDLKAFMSSRPPDPTAKSQPDTKPSQTPTTSTLPEDAPSLLAQDLELRRLLSESHLLSSPALSTTATDGTAEPKLFTSGRIRAKATDLRMQALGSQTSIFKQEKMPMKLRKGMVARAEAREERRRREARENGIILERPAAGKKSKARERRREIGVDRPGMGRLRGAELRLNEHDVKKMEGSRDTFGRKGGGKRR